MKKKLLPMLVAFIMILCMTMQVSAATPAFKAPTIPKVPEINVESVLSDKVVDNAVNDWIEKHPINIIPINVIFKDWMNNLNKLFKNYF